MDQGYEKSLKHAGRRHDLIAIRISDPKETELPSIGLLELEDAENQRHWTIDTSSQRARRLFSARANERREFLRRLTRAAQTDLIEVSTDGGHLDALIRFFQRRERRLRKT
jgi:hypothetical protein